MIVEDVDGQYIRNDQNWTVSLTDEDFSELSQGPQTLDSGRKTHRMLTGDDLANLNDLENGLKL